MKNVRNLMALLAFGMAVTTASAQEQNLDKTGKRKEVKEMKEGRAAKDGLIEKLQLTPEQKTKFIDIRKRYAEQARTLRAAEGDRASKAKQFEEQRTAREAEIKSLLTEAQFKTYSEHREAQKERIMAKRKKVD